MPLWTLYGLTQGKASTAWPKHGDDGQAGLLGMPRLDPVNAGGLHGLRRNVFAEGDYRDRRGRSAGRG